jgi:hypothetical protein
MSPPGRRRKHLRSAARALREGRPQARDREGDEEVLSLVEDPYDHPEEAHRRLQGLLAAFERRDDRRAVFLTIYVGMTDEVARRVREDQYEDPDWVAEYLVAFANLYREAVRAYEAVQLGAVPDPWQVAFDAAERGDSLVLQDAALGVNAHINYDLALALDRVGVSTDRDTRYDDHAAVTAAIRDNVDRAQDSLVARDAEGLDEVDDALGRLDEWLTVLTIDECRDSAWRTAVALDSSLRLRRGLARWINDVTSTGAAYLILGTQVSDVVHEAMLELEESGL